VGAVLVLCLLAQDPRDRLLEALREPSLKDTEAALEALAARDARTAARGVIAALPRARDRMGQLLSATVAARQAYDSIDTSLGFNIQEEKVKSKSLEAARLRIQAACKAAGEGEKVYDAIRAAFPKLPPEAADTIAAEAARTPSWILKCELYEGLGAMGAAAHLVGALEQEKDPCVLSTVLHGLASARGKRFLDHAAWQVRLGALHAVRKEKEAVPSVLDALELPDLRFRNQAFRTLVELTGTELPADKDVWQDWWKANSADFVAGTYVPGLRRERPGAGRTTFYGIPVLSSRVCFVIDRSGSMRENGRFDAAKAELKKLVGELPAGARFNVLFFGGTSTAFGKTMRILDDHVRREALEFVDRMGLEAGTDLYAALEKAVALVGSPESGILKDEGPDTIVVLSDGLATVGRLVDDELVARVITRRSRYLRPVLHTVSLSSDARSLKLLSDLSGGEYRVK
jgi:hypothetical protein